MNKQQKIVSWILRIIGFFGMLATGAMLMPFSWMLAIHEHLGLGKMPQEPVVQYLARSLSAFYAMVGVMFWYVSFRVPQYWDFVRLVAILFIVFGGVLWWVDVKSQMPLLWTLQEAPPAILVGLWMLYLHHTGSESPEQHQTG
jgi:hypothetical protein